VIKGIISRGNNSISHHRINWPGSQAKADGNGNITRARCGSDPMAKSLGYFKGSLSTGVRQENGKFVATIAKSLVSASYRLFHDTANLLENPVAG